ncbi:MAG: hypothetical protein EOO15_10880 [Chitinophagaceae bacterium]|nr:MAG: hypothetical protein EOO15_10880 [Chitinophagaceae bacterium]
MKYRLCTFLSATLITISASAQPKIPGTSVFRDDMQKVVADFPHDFARLRGKRIDASPQTVEYASNVAPAGASESSITEYSSGGKAIYSWQTVLLRSEDFAEAAKKYKWAYQQLKGMNVRYVVDQYTLEGSYGAPDESKSFAITDLSIAHPPSGLRRLRVRVQLQLEENEWKVSLSVFEKEKEDNEMASAD